MLRVSYTSDRCTHTFLRIVVTLTYTQTCFTANQSTTQQRTSSLMGMACRCLSKQQETRHIERSRICFNASLSTPYTSNGRPILSILVISFIQVLFLFLHYSILLIISFLFYSPLLFLLLGLGPLFCSFCPFAVPLLSRTAPKSNRLSWSFFSKKTRNTCKTRLFLHCLFPTSGSQSGSKSHSNRSMYWLLHAGEKSEWA